MQKLEDALLEAASRAIRDSDYEGWVAYIDNAPVFEAVALRPALAQPARGARVLPIRPENRATREWKDLPHEKVHRVELYFARERYPNQPVMRIDRQPGNPDMRFLQMKLGGIVVDALAGAARDGHEAGQRRLGVVGYRIGYWNPARRDCSLYEITRAGFTPLGSRPHPCWPEPWGFALAPWVVGLTETQVPAPPVPLVTTD